MDTPEHFQLQAEVIGPKRLRLILWNMGQMVCCRKTSIKEINLFLEGHEQHLFKGRLQLERNQEKVKVKHLGKNVLNLEFNHFLELLPELH